jgi:NAD(P)H-hydrate repair Nnr-like enzyme with NAD(P)H-hydrate dehydratase domain
VHAHDVNSTSTAASETAAETVATASAESQDRNACVQACALACMVSKRASELAFAAHGRSMTAPDVVEHIGAAFQEFYPEG